MSCLEKYHIITEGLVAIGTFLAGFAAILTLPKIARTAIAKLSNETLFGEEAKKKYDEIKQNLPKNSPYVWGPCLWEGGDIGGNYMLEIRAHIYSPDTGGCEWKNIKKSIRYIYREEEKLMVKGWRIKG